MPELIYIPWGPEEEDNLLSWLSQHHYLSWREKSKKYLAEFGHYRSPDSLRGKQYQLMKGVRRQRLFLRRTLVEFRCGMTRRAPRRRRSTLSDTPTAHCALRVANPNVRSCLLQQRQQQCGSHSQPDLYQKCEFFKYRA